MIIQKVVELAPGELASIPKGQAPLLSFFVKVVLGPAFLTASLWQLLVEGPHTL